VLYYVLLSHLRLSGEVREWLFPLFRTQCRKIRRPGNEGLFFYPKLFNSSIPTRLRIHYQLK
jgi:hypothetical protein